jgi:Lon protease-like protein
LPLLPLFPLDVVLLPGTELPLHIFEPRYKEMISECISTHAPFGVVRAVEQSIADVGCTAEIISVTRKYADGKLDLVAQGRQRFEVLKVNQERAFLRAEVLYVPDEPGDVQPNETARVLELHRQILMLAGVRPGSTEHNLATLSFDLAGSLPLDLDFKQNLLTTRSEGKRIQLLAAYLERILPALRPAAQARAKSGGNGHVH